MSKKGILLQSLRSTEMYWCANKYSVHFNFTYTVQVKNCSHLKGALDCEVIKSNVFI